MAVLAKPCEKMIFIDSKSSQDFIKRFNESVITPEKLASCKKALRLFSRENKECT